MYSTSKMIGKINFNEKLHKYLHSLASKTGLNKFKVLCQVQSVWKNPKCYD
jgi:hypothetical protein